MPRFRRDEFIYDLFQLVQDYPEYKRLVQLLIEQIREGRETSIQEKLRQLRDEDW